MFNEAILLMGGGYCLPVYLMETNRMYAPWVQIGRFQCIFRLFLLKMTEKYKSGALGDFPLLHYFRNSGIKNTGLIKFFHPLQTIITVLLLVRT